MPKKYIDADGLYEKIHNIGGCDADPDTWSAGWDEAIDECLNLLESMPAADVQKKAETKKTTEAAKTRHREQYYFYKEHGICTNCGKEYAEVGKTLCPECAEKSRKLMLKTTEARKQKARERCREKYYEYKSLGICTSCHKRKAYDGLTTCKICNEKKKRKLKDKRIEMGIMPREIFNDGHHCTRCGVELPLNHKHKVCDKCYPELVESAKHMNEFCDRSYFRDTMKTFFLKGG